MQPSAMILNDTLSGCYRDGINPKCHDALFYLSVSGCRNAFHFTLVSSLKKVHIAKSKAVHLEMRKREFARVIHLSRQNLSQFFEFFNWSVPGNFLVRNTKLRLFNKHCQKSKKHLARNGSQLSTVFMA